MSIYNTADVLDFLDQLNSTQKEHIIEYWKTHEMPDACGLSHTEFLYQLAIKCTEVSIPILHKYLLNKDYTSKHEGVEKYLKNEFNKEPLGLLCMQILDELFYSDLVLNEKNLDNILYDKFVPTHYKESGSSLRASAYSSQSSHLPNSADENILLILQDIVNDTNITECSYYLNKMFPSLKTNLSRELDLKKVVKDNFKGTADLNIFYYLSKPDDIYKLNHEAMIYTDNLTGKEISHIIMNSNKGFKSLFEGTSDWGKSNILIYLEHKRANTKPIK